MAKMDKKTEKPIDYSKPLKNNKHERFSQEYVVDLNATDSYQTAYPKASRKTAEANGCTLLRNAKNAKIVGRIAHLQAKLSEASGVTAEMLMAEWKKIGFANIKGVVRGSNEIKDISKLPDDVKASISSISTTKNTTKVTMHSKETALENMGKHIGFYERDNEQKKENLADFLKAFKGE